MVLSKSSIHFFFATFGKSYMWKEYKLPDINFCEYCREVLKGGIVVLGLVIFFSTLLILFSTLLLSLGALCIDTALESVNVAAMFSWKLKSFGVSFVAVSSVVASLIIFNYVAPIVVEGIVCGIDLVQNGLEWLRGPNKVDGKEKPHDSFFECLYLKFKEKTCFKIEFR